MTISKLRDDIEALSKFRITNETLRKQLRQREEEVGVLRAKQFLDLFSLNIKLVPEYPDMVEDNEHL